MSSSTARILVINPNSSESITDGLKSILDSNIPPGVQLEYMTGPSNSPPSINDAPTSIQSAHYVFERLKSQALSSVDAILVCCFSDHPLVAMIRHEYSGIPCVHILESSISSALSTSSKPFAILTTGSDMVSDINRGVLSFMGGISMRYVGCIATDLGVLELRDPASQTKVQQVIRQRVHEIAGKNVGAIVLGCAGMAGMEGFIRQCLTEAIGSERAHQVAIIDGAKAGIHLLAALHRCNF